MEYRDELMDKVDELLGHGESIIVIMHVGGTSYKVAALEFVGDVH